MPELSILIATVSTRTTLLSRLLSNLETQVVLCPRDVEVIVHHGEYKPMGQKFNELYAAARGRLAVQVDDDDQVVFDYVDQILQHSPSHDYVGYKTMVTVNGNLQNKVIYTSDPRQAKHQPFGPRNLVRHVSPKNPILTAQAQRFAFGSFFGADWDWIAAVIEDGFPHSPTFIDEVLYHYDCWPGHSLGTRPEEWTAQRVIEPYYYNPLRFTWIE